MSVKSISWAKTINETLFYKAASPVTSNIKNIDNVYNMLKDEASKSAYEQELAYKILYHSIHRSDLASTLTGGISLEYFNQLREKALTDQSLPKISLNKQPLPLPQCFVTIFYLNQYCYELENGKKITVEKDDIVLDCGGFYGESAVWAQRNGAKKVYAFEISPNNLKIMKETFSNNNCEDVGESVPLALSNQEGEIYFNADKTNPGAGVISSVKQNNSIVVPVTTIDNFCEKNSIIPNFIKMDIEGAEFDALRGAVNTIKQYRPKLAICLYHYIEDMWRIPLLINNIEPNYKFYCKKSHPYAEFVLFAQC